MEPSSPRWLSDLVKDDISISFPHDHQYEMMLQSLHDYTLNNNNPTNNNNSFSPKTKSPLLSATCSTTRNLEKSPSISSTSSKMMISFGGDGDHAAAEAAASSKQIDELVISSKKKKMSCNSAETAAGDDHILLSSSPSNKGKLQGVISNRRRSPFYGGGGHEHVVAERKRREKISQRLIALSALLPNLKKMDKASVLGEATKYVQHLQERINKLKADVAIKTVVLVKKPHLIVSSSSLSAQILDNNNNNSYSSSSDNETSGLPEIEARVSQRNVLIRVHCERRPSCSAKILDLLEKMNLSVLNNSVLSFGTSLLDITIVAQMEVEFSMTIEELVKNLRQHLLNCIM